MNTKRILVVDDEPLVLRVLRLALEKKDYIVETQPNGLAALESILASPPDALITDIEMPKMSGKELCERISADCPNREFPIFVATSQTDLEHRDWSGAIKNLSFIEKPMSSRKLLASLEKYFKSRDLVHGDV